LHRTVHERRFQNRQSSGSKNDGSRRNDLNLFKTLSKYKIMLQINLSPITDLQGCSIIQLAILLIDTPVEDVAERMRNKLGKDYTVAYSSYSINIENTISGFFIDLQGFLN
jgi:hypothetical protein